MKQMIYIVIGLIVWIGCSSKELSPTKYIQWLQNNKKQIQWTTQQKDFDFRLSHRPLDWMVLREGGKELDASKYSTIQKEYEGLEYYHLEIQGESKGLLEANTGGITTYEDRLMYCSFDMQKDLKMVSEGDSLNCQLFHFERTFKATPAASFVLAFEKPKNELAERNIVFRAQALGFKTINWTIANGSFQQIPNLKL